MSRRDRRRAKKVIAAVTQSAAVGEEEIFEVADTSKPGRFTPMHQRTKNVKAAYHPGIVVMICMKIEGEQSGGPGPARAEYAFIEEYRLHRFPALPGAPLWDYARYVLASEFAARAFHLDGST